VFLSSGTIARQSGDSNTDLHEYITSAGAPIPCQVLVRTAPVI